MRLRRPGLTGPAALGCMTCGNTLKDLGQSDLAAAEATVRGVIDGSVYREIKSWQSKQMLQNADIAATKLEIDKLPTSPEKDTLLSKWGQANQYNRSMYSKLREAVDKYNQLARIIQSASLNAIQPSQLAGLNQIPLAVIPAVLASAAALAIALAVLLAALKVDFNKGDGIVAEIRKSIGEVGGVVKEGAKFTYEMTTLLALIIGGYFAFQIWQGARSRPRLGYAGPAPAPVAPRPEILRKAEGEVVE